MCSAGVVTFGRDSFFICYTLHMAINPLCDKCKTELNDFGAILLSPPDERSTVKKFHICKECYEGYAKDLS